MSKPKAGKIYRTEIPVIVESDHPLTKEELAQVRHCIDGDWVFPLSFDLSAFKIKP